jgi:hypothetical protein
MDGKILALVLALAAPAALGCVKKPYQGGRCDRPDLSGCVIEDLSIVGNHAVGDGDIEEKIATAETSHVLGGVVKDVPVLGLWDRLTVDYERLDPFVLQRDLERIERYYRTRGYYEAHVHAGRVIRRPDRSVQVEIAVDEGLPMQIGKVDLEWKDWSLPLAVKVTPAVKDAAASLKPGDVFQEDAFEDTKKKILRAMTDRGFAYAKVEGKANVDLARHQARVVYTLELGPRCVFGDISIEGQGELPTVPLLAALQIKKGAEFSTATLDSAEIALGDLGLFGSIDVDPKRSAPGEPPNPVIPVVFRVQPVALRAVKLGVGGQLTGLVDRIEAHGLAGWEHRNLFGGLRHFSVELSPAVTFNFPSSTTKTIDAPEALPPPTDAAKPVLPVAGDRAARFSAPTASTDAAKPYILPEFKLRASLTQPGVLLPLDARTAGLLNGSFRLYRPNIDNRVGYVEGAGGAGLTRSFWNSHVKLGASLNGQYDAPFKGLGYEGTSVLTDLFIPYVHYTAELDFRSSEAKRIDPLNPHSGVYLLNDFQFAFGFPGNLRTADFRFRPEIRGYVPVTRRVTLALRLVAGFLYPFNYGDKIGQGDEGKTDEQKISEPCADYQRLQFRGFFSGGSTSNRGYAYQGVGPHAKTCLSTLKGQADNSPPAATGGFNLWESSVELRFPILGKLGSVVFADASDVSAATMRLCAPHLSAGFGLRYETPVGALRADVGFRIPGFQVFDSSVCKAEFVEVPDADREGRTKRVWKDEPSAIAKVLPIALSVAIGEAF